MNKELLTNLPVDNVDFTKRFFGELTFNEKEHRYTFEGKDFVSVTTFIHNYFPPFHEEEQAMAYSKRLLSKGINKSVVEILEEWKEKREYGTEVHNALEEQIIPAKTSYKRVKDFDEVNKGLDALRGFVLLHDIIAVYPEVRIFDKEVRLAGTIDLLMVKRDGSIIIGDWKTSNSIYKGDKTHNTHPLTNHLPANNYTTYSLQMSVYGEILSRRGFDVRGCSLFHLIPPSKIVDKSLVIYPTPFLQEDVKKIFADRIIDLK